MVGLEASTQCAPCPTGIYCVDGTLDQTKRCDAGYYCHSRATAPDMEENLCPAGYYCELGTLLPEPCPDGYYSLAGAGEEEDCKVCELGYYCIR